MQVHTTQDGTKMLIAEMETDHLFRTLDSYCRKLKVCREVLENPNGFSGDVMIQALQPGYSPEACRERAQDLIVDLHEKVQPYILEAVIRGMNINEIVQDAYGRKAGIPSQINMAMRLFFNRSLTD